MAMNLASIMLSPLTSLKGSKSGGPGTDNQAASIVAAREAALKKERAGLVGKGLGNSMNSTSPLGITGSASMPAGYKTLLGS